MGSNGDEPSDRFSRNITSAKAQREHEGLGKVKTIASQHTAKKWRDCDTCKRRMRKMLVWVEGKPV